MDIDQQQIPILTALATAFAAVLIAPVVQIIIGLKQAKSARISAEAALRNSYNTGRHAIANSRQKWIDTLRDTLSEFHSLVMTENEYPYPKEIDRKLSMLGTKIELFLNPTETESKELLDLVNKIYDLKTVQEREQLDLSFVAASQKVLKKEWVRVKKELDSFG